MEVKKIGEFIKIKRKEKGLTQEQLAEKLFVTEKAISRWETGRGTPDISLLIPLAQQLNISTSELLNGSENTENKDNIDNIIEYVETNKKGKYNLPFKISIICYVVSVLIFLCYLRFDYNSTVELNYFVRLTLVIVASLLVLIGNYIYCNNYIDKLEDRARFQKFSLILIAIYYFITLFNMVIFSRYTTVNGYNLIPFKSIIEGLLYGSNYYIVINILGNMFVFMPVQYFIIKIFNINKFKINLLISLIIIVLSEVIQFIFKLGIFDIDDIILNVFGMMVFFYMYNALFRKREISRKMN